MALRRLLSLSGLEESQERYYAGRLQHPAHRVAYCALRRAEHQPLGPVAVPRALVAGGRDPPLATPLFFAPPKTSPRYRLVELDAGHWLPETHRSVRSPPGVTWPPRAVHD